MSKKVKAQDVARAAQTSAAAVSRAFRPDAPISDALRARILAEAARLNYVSPEAQSVARLGVKSVTFVTGEMENPYFPMLIDTLEKALYARGKQLRLIVASEKRDIDMLGEQVLSWRSEGVLLANARMSTQLARVCRAADVPVVLLDRIQADDGIAAVGCDNYRSARRAAEHFLGLGLKRIGFLGGLPDTSTHMERKMGFTDRLREAGLGLAAYGNGNYRYDTARSIAEAFMKHNLDGIFCANDLSAFAVIDTLRSQKSVAASKIRVIGFDDLQMASWPSYNLTTFRQPLPEMVDAALAQLDALRLGAKPEIQIFRNAFIRRQSA